LPNTPGPLKLPPVGLPGVNVIAGEFEQIVEVEPPQVTFKAGPTVIKLLRVNIFPPPALEAVRVTE
jgi:hypothetical protein